MPNFAENNLNKMFCLWLDKYRQRGTLNS